MSKPLIGITTYRSKKGHYTPISVVGQPYVDSIVKAGGIPLLIPVELPDDQLTHLCNRLDGLVMSGGGDIDPARYGEMMHPDVEGVDITRDDIEVNLIKLAIKERLPFLAICRGIQVINVALGGTLYTHISDQLPDSLWHPCYPDLPRDLLAHEVSLEGESKLSCIFKSTNVQVNSLHHQGIKDVAPGLNPSGIAPDGLVESVEIQGHPFGIGVQWHPEAMPASMQMQALFRAFVEASKE